MKKLISASLFLAASVAANAHGSEIVYKAADDSAPSAVCMAAVTSLSAARKKAEELGFDRPQWLSLACNGEPVFRFAKADAPAAPSTGFVSVKTADASPVTELCVASITSSEKFETLKQTHFSGVSNLESIVQCNGLPLRSFMLKYNSRDLTAAL